MMIGPRIRLAGAAAAALLLFGALVGAGGLVGAALDAALGR